MKAEQGAALRHACVFHYEAGYDEYVRRMWSHAARIHMNTMEDFDWNTLSTRGQHKDYELSLFGEEIAKIGLMNVDGERERLASATSEILAPNIQLFDFSGPPES